MVIYYKLDFTGNRKKETSYWRNRVMIAAKKFTAPGRRKVRFAVSNADDLGAQLNDPGLETQQWHVTGLNDANCHSAAAYCGQLGIVH